MTLRRVRTFDMSTSFLKFAYCIYKPDDTRSVENHVINLFNEYYENKNDIKNYNGVSYIEYNKYYDEENEESLVDEVSKIEKFYKININVYNNDISTIDEKAMKNI